MYQRWLRIPRSLLPAARRQRIGEPGAGISGSRERGVGSWERGPFGAMQNGQPARKTRLPVVQLCRELVAIPAAAALAAVPIAAATTSAGTRDRKSTRLNSSHGYISYAVFCLKKK